MEARGIKLGFFMPVAPQNTSDAALEAKVFWIRYRKEMIALLVVLLLGIFGFAGYRFYNDRRDAAAADLFASAKSAADYQRVIDQYGDTASAASAYLLLADEQRKTGKFAEANATVQKFLEKFPRHELNGTARMAIAANFESLGKTDDALAAYQQFASTNALNFNAPWALLAEVRILQAKNRDDEARQVCETILTRYRDSYASLEAMHLLRTLKPAATPALSAIPKPSVLPTLAPSASPR